MGLTTKENIYFARSREQGVFGVTLLAAAILLWLRRPDFFLNPQFWAEDGAVFFQQMHEEGWRSLLLNYQGYYHLLPRLIAAFCSVLDPAHIPTAYFLVSVFFNITAVAWVYTARIDLPSRPLVSLCLLLVPHTGEVLLNITNLQWVLAPSLLLLILSRDPETPQQWAFDLIALTIFGLTGPFIVLWLPLFAWRVWRRRSFASACLGLLAMITAGIQTSAILRFYTTGEKGTIFIDHLFQVLGNRIWGSLLSPNLGVPPVFLSFVVALCGWGLAIFLARDPSYKRDLRLSLLLAGGLIVAATIYKFRFDLIQLTSTRNADRYFYVPKILILWLFVFELNALSAWRRRLAWIVLLLGLIASASSFRAHPLIDYSWKKHAREINTGNEVVIPINPQGWTVRLNSGAKK